LTLLHFLTTVVDHRKEEEYNRIINQRGKKIIEGMP
jgi:hypothetical protein